MKTREDARQFIKRKMGPLVTELGSGQLIGAVNPELMIDWMLEYAAAPATPATPKWGGTQQRDDLKPCPFCGTKAISQGRLADNSTEQQWRIQCGNPFCTMQCVTHTCASFSDAVRNWESRVAEAAPTTPQTQVCPGEDHRDNEKAKRLAKERKLC